MGEDRLRPAGLMAALTMAMLLATLPPTVTADWHGLTVNLTIADSGNSRNENPDEGIQVTVAMVGEMAWCEDHAATWELDMENRFYDVVAPAFADTDAEPELIWMGCTLTEGSWTYNHSVDDAAHCHDAICSDWHPYVFNKVDTDPGHKIDDGSTGGADDGYLYALPHFDGEDMPNALGGEVGIEAYAWHFRQHDDLAKTDLVQLVHDEKFQFGTESASDETLGAAPEPGTISAFYWGQDVYASTHETGHNLAASHCAAAVQSDHDGTVMVDPEQCSYWTQVNRIINEFSSDNVDNVNSYVTSTYG